MLVLSHSVIIQLEINQAKFSTRAVTLLVYSFSDIVLQTYV